jgi:toxin FitB
LNYLLDTCVISELVKPEPDEKLVAWLRRQSEEALFLSCITIGEIQKGISRLPECRKKHNLHQWLESELLEQFAQKIIMIDVKVTRVWGDIQAVAEKAGARMPAIDSLIASIGIAYDMTVVTRNAADMQVSGVRLFNPWD